ncbi:hypothetical protein L227DRAFT_132549 [Lentinus tigrinus ALCF2SS1-6]|uniref:Uncharacterized protein n=2 Tax=Lentinus tigrinus TaxID=5365 RepID=A0A5C2SQH6_9APHY|nr:hypothetical protein L227DRAFT_132549 [Lentinus tigrinus ALCF2SS1-6]
MVGPVLTHAQTGPMRRAQAMEGASQDSRMMPPPALPSMSSRAADPRSALGQPATSSGLQQRSSILPPASASGSRRFIPQTPSKSSASISVATSSRPFVLATPQQKVQQPQRFLPSSAHPSVAIAGSRSTVMVGAGAVSQAPSRSPSIAVSGSAGQRAPFVPGTVR